MLSGGPGFDIEIQGFSAGAGSEDAIDLRRWPGHYAGPPGDALRSADGSHHLGQVTSLGVDAPPLHQDDFLLA